jgi:hypothetical protein
MSKTQTLYPARAKTIDHPTPILPAPTTANLYSDNKCVQDLNL